ncbi:ABC transporter permease [Paenirhodobacter sp.]|uniref:ABC transporter permease n=1 Tax=Paenirhodobacter sp. TaxID=1965326 RepID=UPI003B41A38B
MAATLLPTFRREIRRIAAQPGLLFMLGPCPLLLFALLASIFHAGLPTGLPVAVVDLDGSQTSRQIVRMVDATPDLDVAARLPNLSEARQALLSGEVYGIVMIPENTERDLLSGARPEVVTFYNNQMLTVGGIVARASATALNGFAAGVSLQVRQAQGQDKAGAMAAVNPVPVQQSPLFNPALDYTQFLLAAVMPSMLQIFICASAVMALAQDRGRPLVAKLAPYGIVFLGLMWLADAIIFGYFGAPFRGSIALHLAYTVLFVLACLSLGAVLALATRDTVRGLGLAGLLTAPAFGFAGIGFPRAAMNGFALTWGAMLPLTPYLQLRTDQVVRGADVAVSLPALAWLGGLVLLYGGLAWALSVREGRA